MTFYVDRRGAIFTKAMLQGYAGTQLPGICRVRLLNLGLVTGGLG